MSADLISQTSTTTGTGPFTLAVDPGFNTFASAYATGVPFFVGVQGLDADGAQTTERLTGIGQLLPDGRLQVDSVTASSNGNTAVSFTSASLVLFDPISVGAVTAIADAQAAAAVAAIELFDLWRLSRFGSYLGVSNVNVVPTTIGLPTLVETGGAQANISASTIFSATQRRRYNTAATAGAAAGARSQPIFLRDFDGFRFSVAFGIADAASVAGARMFVGLRAASTAATDVQIDSVVNAIGIGHEAGDAGFSIFHNDATGTATKVALDAAKFPATTRSTDIIRIEIITRKAAGDVVVTVTNTVTGETQSATLSADLPAFGVGLTPTWWRSNGVTAAVASLEFFRALADPQGGLP